MRLANRGEELRDRKLWEQRHDGWRDIVRWEGISVAGNSINKQTRK